MLCCCLFILKFASFVIFSLLWLKSPSFLFFILTCLQTFALAELSRSGRSLLNLIGCVFCWVSGFLIGLKVEEQMLIVLDSSKPKEVISRCCGNTLHLILKSSSSVPFELILIKHCTHEA